jgi:hypothetical protein
MPLGLYFHNLCFSSKSPSPTIRSDLYFHSSPTGENFSLHSVLELAKYTPVQGPRHTAELCSAPQSTQRCWAQGTRRCIAQPRKAHSGALLSPVKYTAVLGPRHTAELCSAPKSTQRAGPKAQGGVLLSPEKYTAVLGPRHKAELCSAQQSTQRCRALCFSPKSPSPRYTPVLGPRHTAMLCSAPQKVHSGAGPKTHNGALLSHAKYTVVLGPRHTTVLCSAPQSTQWCWAQDTQRCFAQPRKVHSDAGPKAHSDALLTAEPCHLTRPGVLVPSCGPKKYQCCRRDPVPFGPLDPGSENQDPDPRYGMNIPDHISERA